MARLKKIGWCRNKTHELCHKSSLITTESPHWRKLSCQLVCSLKRSKFQILGSVILITEQILDSLFLVGLTKPEVGQDEIIFTYFVSTNYFQSWLIGGLGGKGQ